MCLSCSSPRKQVNTTLCLCDKNYFEDDKGTCQCIIFNEKITINNLIYIFTLKKWFFIFKKIYIYIECHFTCLTCINKEENGCLTCRGDRIRSNTIKSNSSCLCSLKKFENYGENCDGYSYIQNNLNKISRFLKINNFF